MAGLEGWVLAKDGAAEIGISVSCLHRRALRGTIRTRMVGMIRLFNHEDIKAIAEVKRLARDRRQQVSRKTQGGLL
jgi:hypothetical protein